MRYFLIAGERSGDLHGSNLITELHKVDGNAEVICWGGDLMESAGALLLTHYREIQVMGIWEVIKNLFSIFANLKKCQKDIIEAKPDVVILIDFGGFNMRIAKYLRNLGVEIHYYIPPKIWAWNTGRARKMKKYIDHLYCILPFEKDFYHKYGLEADYVGNPVVDAIRNFKPSENFLNKYNLNKEYIALLPGSRKQEVSTLLPIMLAVTDEFPDETFVVAGVKNLPNDFYSDCSKKKNVHLVFEENYNILSNAKVAIVTSGTATLETGLFEVPQVVVYKTSLLTYLVGKILVKVKYLSLVNLIAGKGIVKELIQDECNPKELKLSLKEILQLENHSRIIDDYKEMKTILGSNNTSKQTAELIYQYIK